MMASNENDQNELQSTTSSILLTQSNLAWSQPSGFVLTSPVPIAAPTPSSESPNVAEIETINRLTIDSQQQPQNGSENVLENFDPPPPSSSTFSSQSYQEVDFHWFYQKDPEEHPEEWQAFSMLDSYHLETAYRQGRLEELIPTNGTRFDVQLRERIRQPVYWQGPQGKVQRCSWFYKNENDHHFIPYSEHVSELLETNYRDCILSNQWNRRLNLPDSNYVIFYAPDSVYHFSNDPGQYPSGWSALMTADSSSQPGNRSRYAYRGPWSIQTEPERDESASSVQNLVFFVHGIGEFCDLSFRPLKDVVDDFRTMTHDLVQTHYGPSAGRVELLPISWHRALHTESLDERLREITLPSITRLRSFTNDTILDALFYTSPTYSTSLLNFVAKEMNRLYGLFLQRNPYFCGKIALAGHSLGSLILFDLLWQQSPQEANTLQNQQNQTVEQIHFRPVCLFALGSPLAAFLTVRGIDLNQNFRLPTCPAFYNIFHPYDPIAYRLEPLINREFSKLKPVLIPHHKGRKRIHLELRDSLQRVSTDIKQKFMSGLKGAWNSISGFARAHYEDPVNLASEDSETNAVANSELTSGPVNSMPNSVSVPNSLSELAAASDLTESDLNRILSYSFGQLNRGRRLDFVLQEKPFEIVNEYVFAISSHGCYWFSEDTSLLMLRELYDQPDIDASVQTPAISDSASNQN